jgi:hypothetical protein
MFFKTISDEDLEKYRQFFLENDHVILKDILTAEGKEYLNKIEFQSTAGDLPQFGRNHNREEFRYIIDKYVSDTKDIYKKIIGEQFFSTFAFAMEYIKDNYVNPHLDLIINEISSTVCYYSNGQYPLYMSSEFMENNYNHRYSLKDHNSIPLENRIKMDIGCGDVGIFNGRNHLHWREKLTDDISYRAILSHYCCTIGGSDEWNKKISEEVPHENNLCAIYTSDN